jgi:hypothetical protein
MNGFSPYNVNISSIKNNYSGLKYGTYKIFDIFLFINIIGNQNLGGGGGGGVIFI